jgi:hypothetical protein
MENASFKGFVAVFPTDHDPFSGELDPDVGAAKKLSS